MLHDDINEYHVIVDTFIMELQGSLWAARTHRLTTFTLLCKNDDELSLPPMKTSSTLKTSAVRIQKGYASGSV